VVATVLTVIVVGGVGFAISKALQNSANPADVVIPPASTTLGAHAAVPVDFTLPNLSGSGSQSLAAALHGRPAVINFFASWCPACQAELAAFGATARRFGTSVSFVGIDTNDSDPTLADTLAHRAGVTYQLLRDIGNGNVAAAYGVNDLPATFIVDAHGRITAELPGTVDAATLTRQLTPLAGAPTR